MAKLTGRIFISLNGQRIRSMPGASLDTGGVTRTPSISDAGVDGFMESISAPHVACKISHGANTSMADLQAFTGTLTFQTDSGRVYTLIEAFNTTPPKLEKGEVSLEYSAGECQEG
jgi:hypothetical protein